MRSLSAALSLVLLLSLGCDRRPASPPAAPPPPTTQAAAVPQPSLEFPASPPDPEWPGEAIPGYVSRDLSAGDMKHVPDPDYPGKLAEYARGQLASWRSHDPVARRKAIKWFLAFEGNLLSASIRNVPAATACEDIHAEIERSVLGDHALTDPDPEIRICAALLLSPTAAQNPEVIPILRQALALPRWRMMTLHALRSSDPPGRFSAMGPDVIALLNDPNAWVRTWALDALLYMRADPGILLPAILPLLHDKNVGYRRQAIQILGVTGPPARVAMPDLVAALSDADDQVRDYAATSLVELDAPPETVVEPLLSLLRDPTGRMRRRAVYCLTTLKCDPARVVPELVKLLGDKGGDARSDAMEALAGYGRVSVGPLKEALSRPEPAAREDAARALERLGAQAAEAVPALQQACQDTNYNAAKAALFALAAVAPQSDEAFQCLVKAHERWAFLDMEIAERLAENRAHAKEATPVLAAMIQARSSDREMGTIENTTRMRVLLELVSHGRQAVGRLTRIIEGTDAEIGLAVRGRLEQEIAQNSECARAEAFHALRILGTEAADAVPCLVKECHREDGDAGQAAATLVVVAPRSREAYEGLLAAYRRERPGGMRYHLAEALAAYGTDAREIAPDLEEDIKNCGADGVTPGKLKKLIEKVRPR